MGKQATKQLTALADALHGRYALLTELKGDFVFAADGEGFELAAKFDKGRFIDACNDSLLGSTAPQVVRNMQADQRLPANPGNCDTVKAKASIAALKKLAN